MNFSTRALSDSASWAWGPTRPCTSHPKRSITDRWMKAPDFIAGQIEMNHRPVVLVVDDRPENLVTIEAVLEPLDVTIQKALRADAALLFLLQNDADVILLDVEMPELDGFQTARLIRERPRAKDTQIIFVTAVDRGTDIV